MRSETLVALLFGFFAHTVVKNRWTESRIYPKCCVWWKFTHLFWILVILHLQSEGSKKGQVFHFLNEHVNFWQLSVSTSLYLPICMYI